MKKIVLITDIFTPYSTRSSTQLVMQSAIFALSKSNCDLFVIGIYDFCSNPDDIHNFLKSLNVRHILINSKINTEKNSKIKNVCLFSLECLYPKIVFDKKVNSLPFIPDRIISSIPSIEAGCVGMVLKKKFPSANFTTMWTDVLAYNCLNKSNKLPFRRFYLKLIESKLLKRSSLVYYLGECQCNFMKKAYHNYSKKMNFYYPSFFPFAKERKKESDKINVIYFGNMSKNLRDISSLFNAAKILSYINFVIIGTGDIQLHEDLPSNLTYKVLTNKISNFNEAINIESLSSISIVFLNKNGFSLPGKLFYYLHFHRCTLVIKDGPFKDDIESQLSKFECFYFCENNVESIVTAIKNILKNNSFKTKKQVIDFFSPTERFKFLN